MMPTNKKFSPFRDAGHLAKETISAAGSSVLNETSGKKVSS
jgi:hypothetical protein